MAPTGVVVPIRVGYVISTDVEELQPAGAVVVAHAIDALASEGREAGPEVRERLVGLAEEVSVPHV